MGRVPWGCFGWLPTLTARAALRMASLLPGLLIATDDLPCMQVLTTARPLDHPGLWNLGHPLGLLVPDGRAPALDGTFLNGGGALSGASDPTGAHLLDTARRRGASVCASCVHINGTHPRASL